MTGGGRTKDTRYAHIHERSHCDSAGGYITLAKLVGGAAAGDPVGMVSKNHSGRQRNVLLERNWTRNHENTLCNIIYLPSQVAQSVVLCYCVVPLSCPTALS